MLAQILFYRAVLTDGMCLLTTIPAQYSRRC